MPSGQSNFGKGFLTAFISRLQRSGNCIVRVRTSGLCGNETRHFLGGLDVELLRVELETLGVVHARGGLHAEKDFVGAGVLVFDVVGVVGGDERDAEVFFELEHRFDDGLIRAEVVVLGFRGRSFLSRTWFRSRRRLFWRLRSRRPSGAAGARPRGSRRSR